MFALENKQIAAEMWQQYQQTRQAAARDQLILAYLPLVKIVAGRLAIGLPLHVDRDDLVSNGILGLIDAIHKYDPGRGIKFETYAVARIRGAILDGLRAQDWVPVTLRQKARRVETVMQSLENQLGRAATDTELAQALGISAEELERWLSQLSICTIVSLDELEQGKDSHATRVAGNPETELEYIQIREILAKAIDRLPEKERLVVALYYYEGLTLKEISQVLRLSEARISQLHTKAIFRLRGSLARFKSTLLD